jgi:curved DNA-binding protein CbpA
MGNRDYYEIMRLDPDADGAMVEQQYWQLAKEYNASEDPRTQSQLDELNEAYGVLGTPRLREQYDAFRLDVERTRGVIRPQPARPQGKGFLSGLRLPMIGKSRRPATPERPAPLARVPQPDPEPRRSPVEPSAPALVAERAGRPRRNASTQDLRASTAAMLGRWRENVAARGATAPEVDDATDATLVDIFRSEEAPDEPEEPLTAALDVLRGAGKAPR